MPLDTPIYVRIYRDGVLSDEDSGVFAPRLFVNAWHSGDTVRLLSGAYQVLIAQFLACRQERELTVHVAPPADQATASFAATRQE